MRQRLARLVAVGATLGACLPAAGSLADGGRVYDDPEAVQPLAPGSAVPSVRVRTLESRGVDLAALVRNRGALLVFYRGGW